MTADLSILNAARMSFLAGPTPVCIAGSYGSACAEPPAEPHHSQLNRIALATVTLLSAAPAPAPSGKPHIPAQASKHKAMFIATLHIQYHRPTFSGSMQISSHMLASPPAPLAYLDRVAGDMLFDI
ncbi:hypothetical protein FA95DRAFT_1613467 [Auriscalpium vulgare]|uniref:Uncharacterized protein n=1 Tax=Auriscalpium vulgare TaxID=40419 RepID=A0ACB8R2W0_9AGAM|nr:hypothetical protein FA95DRAFT_1613467 [Auriscalpium vulgare]